MRVAVTGASGLLGRHVVEELLGAGYDVRALDRTPPRARSCPFCAVDIRDLGQMCGAFAGCEAVLHLAALPSPIGHPQEEVFAINAQGTFNVLEAAALLGIRRVVTISSASALGVAYATHPVALQYVPVDEEHPLIPQDAYGLSKLVGEEICRSFHRRTGGTAVSLRFPMIWDSRAHPDLASARADDASKGLGTLWSYIEVRDAARACRLALEAPDLSAEALYVTAPETFMAQLSAELARRFFPTAEVRGDPDGRWSFHDCRRAARLLGFQAEHTIPGLD